MLCSLLIFQHFYSVLGIGIYAVVFALLIKCLCIRQITHSDGACLIILPVQQQVLRSLVDGDWAV